MCNKPREGGLAINLYRKLNMYAKDLNFSIICSILVDVRVDMIPYCLKQNRSTEGCSKLKRSVDMTSSGKNGLNIRTNASPTWDRTRCPEE